MDTDIKKMVDAICSLTVLELCKFVKALRDKFGLGTPSTIRPDTNKEAKTKPVPKPEDNNTKKQLEPKSKGNQAPKKNKASKGNQAPKKNKASKGNQKVDSSETKYIGEGNESVYLYYFRTYKLYAESENFDYWQCNIGRTQDRPEDRVASQIGDQLPEKAILSLVMQINNCITLEKEIHDELKRREQWLNPESDANVVGREWFSTNPVEVEDIFYSIKS